MLTPVPPPALSEQPPGVEPAPPEIIMGSSAEQLQIPIKPDPIFDNTLAAGRGEDEMDNNANAEQRETEFTQSTAAKRGLMLSGE